MLLKIRCPRCATLNNIEADTTYRQSKSSVIPYYGSVTSACDECHKLIIVNYEVTVNVTAVSGPEWDNFREVLAKITKEVENENQDKESNSV